MFLQTILLCTITLTFYSCITLGGPIDPYTVDINRQRENAYFSPSALNSPLSTEKNDFTLSANYAFLTRHKGFDLQSSFIPSKNLGLMGSYRSYNNKNDGTDGNIHSYEMGVGYLHNWGKLHLENYVGIGGGKIKNTHHTGVSTIGFNNFFIQPALVIQNETRTTQFGIIAKLSKIKFEVDRTTFANDREQFVSSQIQLLFKEPNRLFLEPGFIFRTGWEEFLFQSIFSFSNNLSGEDFLRDKTNFSIGLVLRINETKMRVAK